MGSEMCIRDRYDNDSSTSEIVVVIVATSIAASAIKRSNQQAVSAGSKTPLQIKMESARDFPPVRKPYKKWTNQSTP